MAAHALHARTNGREHTKPARAAFLQRFEDQVDPDGKLPPDERRRRAQHALKSHMTSLAIKSARARSGGKQTTKGIKGP